MHVKKDEEYSFSWVNHDAFMCSQGNKPSSGMRKETNLRDFRRLNRKAIQKEEDQTQTLCSQLTVFLWEERPANVGNAGHTFPS